ncbi:MAG: hypothetical protein ACM31D_11500 [Bacteroidota bacterium]
MHLYLDVDGTLLRRSGHARLRGELAPADYLRPFLEWATASFTCIWLTSRSRDGDDGNLRAAFRQAIGPGAEADAVESLLRRITPVAWRDFKAEAIDFAQPFLWLDDAPEEESLDVLLRHGAEASWVPVAIDQRPDDLRRAMAELQRRAEGMLVEA